MESCKKCGETCIHTTGGSGRFYKCDDCGYIGSYARKEPKPKPKKEAYENTAADDYLDFLSGQW
jgi:DNA-directed RNA polymerase subunit M/transcription elongation factor TFIIS